MTARKLTLAAIGALLVIGGVIFFAKIAPAVRFVDVTVVGYSSVDGESVARVQVFNTTSRTLAVMVDGGLKDRVAIADYEQEMNGAKTNWSYRARKTAAPVFIQPNASVNVNVIVPTNSPSKVWIDVTEVLSSPETKVKDRLLLRLIKQKLIEPVKKVSLPELEWNWSTNASSL
jgi:hypothetical protein